MHNKKHQNNEITNEECRWILVISRASIFNKIIIKMNHSIRLFMFNENVE